MKLSKFSALVAVGAMAASAKLSAISLVQTNSPGFYNNTLGTALNNTNGGNTSSGYFPTTDDSSVDFPTAPDLSSVSAQLGNWLTDPLGLNSNWQALASIPNSWTPGNEVAIIYQFDTFGATNVVANFGVDNGIYAWLDGNYIGGARRGGGVFLGEHVFNIGDLGAGTHFLQLLLEDHGGSNGYAVNITADTFVPAPTTPQSVPDSGGIAVYLLGFGALAFLRRLRTR